MIIQQLKPLSPGFAEFDLRGRKIHHEPDLGSVTEHLEVRVRIDPRPTFL